MGLMESVASFEKKLIKANEKKVIIDLAYRDRFILYHISNMYIRTDSRKTYTKEEQKQGKGPSMILISQCLVSFQGNKHTKNYNQF